MNIYTYFQRSLDRWPERESLYVGDTAYTYSGLASRAARIASSLADDKESFTGVFAYRSVTAYSAILGILRAGHAYVPLNPKFPAERNRQILALSGIRTIVVGKECLKSLRESLREHKEGLTLVFPDTKASEVPASLLKSHNCVFPDQKDDDSEMTDCPADAAAYLLFTSGSTGIPKGVPISHGNVNAYIDYLAERYDIRESDRFSQTFDLTFDLSVHDMFLCWSAGASLYVIPEDVHMAPARFIQRHELSVWFSVPTLAQFMARFRMLKQGVFPSLRLSLFCGEPMPLSLAQKWSEAAPGSVVENIYGPTEATIGITHYRFTDRAKEHTGIMSIGKVFSTQHHLVLGEDGTPVVTGEVGELCLGGSQVTTGYWNDQERTSEQFFTLREYPGIRWYRTGDLVREDEEGDLFFISRKDMQIKIRGYRIELGEVSHAINEYLGAEMAVSVPWPVLNGVAESIYSFVDRKFEGREAEIITHLASRLPEYMVPKGIRFIEQFPLTPNGKVSHKTLIAILEEESGLEWTSI